MSEDDGIQKGCVEYVIAEDDFKPEKKGTPPLKPESDRFRKVELVKRTPKKTEDDEEPEIDPDDYVRIQLSATGALFGRQIDVFVHTDIHPAIVQFEGYEFYPHHLAVTKFYPNGSLQHLLKDARNGKKLDRWNGTMKSICVYGLVAAVNHIHNIHDETYEDFSIRYLCPENIVFDAQYQPRLINYVFGNEKLGETPNAYIPPELHADPKAARYDEDIWAIGMILYEILTGDPPYKGKKEDQIKKAIMDGELPEFPPKSDDTNHIIGIIQNCLDKNPLNRPLPYMLYHHLTNTSEDLFPGTNKVIYDNYRNKVQELTILSTEATNYEDVTPTGPDSEVDIFALAEAGDDNALVRVGRMYQKGIGRCELDENKGFDYYMKAAKHDYPIGMYNAALCLSSGRGCKKDQKKSFELMEKAANLELENAVSQYGIWVRDGVGTKADVKKAVKIFQEGADKNMPKCQYILASMYYDGCPPHLKKDTAKALQLYKKASSNGYAEADADLAFHYFKLGKESGDDEQIQKAINLYKKAARKKSAVAAINLGKIYKDGKFVKKDLKQAAEYYKQAAKLNDIQGMVEYGVCLKNGIGVDKDVRGASGYYQQAAVKGDKRGQHNYAKILYEGEGGIRKDILAASRFFKSAADQGVAPSMFYYAKIVINGEGGVARNPAEGKKYLKKYIDKVPQENWIEGTDELIEAVKLKVEE